MAGLVGAGLLLLVCVVVGLFGSPTMYFFPSLITCLMMAWAGIAVFFGMRRIRIRKFLDPHGAAVCPRCHFSLKGLGQEGVCPECSTVFTLARVVTMWEQSYRLGGLYEKVVKAPEPVITKEIERKRKVPWATWSLPAAIEGIEKVAREHGFSGGRFQSFFVDNDQVSEAQRRVLPQELQSFLMWIDVDMWSRFVERNGAIEVRSDGIVIDALWENDEGTKIVPSTLAAITLLGPTELRLAKLGEIASERADMAAFLDRMGNKDEWNNALATEFAVTREDVSVFIAITIPTFKRGCIVALRPENRELVWLGDSLGQWLVRLTVCDGIDMELFPEAASKVDFGLRELWAKECLARKCNAEVVPGSGVN